MGNFDKFKGRQPNSRKPISPEFEVDLCFLMIFLFTNYQLIFVQVRVPTTPKIGNFHKGQGSRMVKIGPTSETYKKYIYTRVGCGLSENATFKQKKCHLLPWQPLIIEYLENIEFACVPNKQYFMKWNMRKPRGLWSPFSQFTHLLEKQ